MLELVFLTLASSVLGVAVRALLESKKPRFYLYHCVPIGTVAAAFTIIYYRYFIPLTMGKWFGFFFLFFMVGYVLSDLIETFIFITTKRGRKR